MKTMQLLLMAGLLALAALTGGCVIHERGYHHHPAHVHGPGCGHELRGGVWITVPVIEVH